MSESLTMSDDYLALLAPLTAQVDQKLKELLSEVDDFPARVGLYGLASGGKRLRPLIFCLTASALGRAIDDQVLTISAAYELLHLASLYHDDIIDVAETRRGRPAAHLAFGLPEALLAADYLIAKSAEVCLLTENLACFEVFIRVVRELTLGELAQLKNQRRVDLPLSDYESIIYRKTGALMEGVGLTAALWLKAENSIVTAIGEFGRSLGLAFQIIDDVLDFEGQPGKLGKPIGQDLDEGRITLPLIIARDRLSPLDRDRLMALESLEVKSPADKAEIG
ncbi:MAG: polyprenyl synthetase family protein, partial [Deltaproteobacteria bacterium]|nr:polyprenyl synthetase family protein [Deltaproteobacteria bacterium]